MHRDGNAHGEGGDDGGEGWNTSAIRHKWLQHYSYGLN
jgi:hypothetical protein